MSAIFQASYYYGEITLYLLSGGSLVVLLCWKSFISDRRRRRRGRVHRGLDGWRARQQFVVQKTGGLTCAGGGSSLLGGSGEEAERTGGWTGGGRGSSNSASAVSASGSSSATRRSARSARAARTRMLARYPPVARDTPPVLAPAPIAQTIAMLLRHLESDTVR